MKTKQTFFRTVCNLAIPVALQSMLQASFSIVDQIMIGQLGSVNVAGVGLAGKFLSIFSVLVSAVGVVAGIMISQYIGQDNVREVRRSFYINLGLAVILAGIFTAVCLLCPRQIMSLYTKDRETLMVSAEYLFIVSGTFLLMAGSSLLSTLFRCIEKAQLPLYANLASLVLNTGLNYILIFGKFGLTPMGAKGAALATLLSQLVNFVVMVVLIIRNGEMLKKPQAQEMALPGFNWRQYVQMLLPILVCEFMWSLGENIYAAIYGNIGTEASAAMTLTNPIQGLTIGALCGLSQAASVIVGKKLGTKNYEDAYDAAKKLIWYGIAGSLILSVIIIFTSPYYVNIYQVEDSVKLLTRQILLAYAIVAPFKVLNMIVGGGIIRSGGKTDYVMYIDMIGTWCFGVPLGLLGAFVLKLPIPLVYFMLSLEECVRLGISIVVFRRKKWMQSLEG
ncbi:MAG: MATE family efflux transporter [Lachnospiraceae bacterium]|nr:MATE family efflux transporter [Lachnospiraceae bacterium]